MKRAGKRVYPGAMRQDAAPVTFGLVCLLKFVFSASEKFDGRECYRRLPILGPRPRSANDAHLGRRMRSHLGNSRGMCEKFAWSLQAPRVQMPSVFALQCGSGAARTAVTRHRNVQVKRNFDRRLRLHRPSPESAIFRPAFPQN